MSYHNITISQYHNITVFYFMPYGPWNSLVVLKYIEMCIIMYLNKKDSCLYPALKKL